MANALRELFTNIASAIKEKTGDNATMKPAEFPDKIRSIDVSETLEDLPIALDFAGGDQEVVAPDGVVVKSAVIQKPESLVSENILKDINIAGIIGTLEVGAKIATGTLENDVKSTPLVIEHNLGVMPDIIFCITNSYDVYPTVIMTFGVSKKFSDTYNFTPKLMVVYKNESNVMDVKHNAIDKYIDEGLSYPAAGVIQNANETTFKLGSSTTHNMKAGSRWVAIGGLT